MSPINSPYEATYHATSLSLSRSMIVRTGRGDRSLTGKAAEPLPQRSSIEWFLCCAAACEPLRPLLRAALTGAAKQPVAVVGLFT